MADLKSRRRRDGRRRVLLRPFFGLGGLEESPDSQNSSMSTVSIADQLKILMELQKLDGEIYRLRRELRVKPEEAAHLKQEHQAHTLALQAADSRTKTLEVKRNQMETDLGQKEQQIKKLQGQMFQVKTNKEYSALQKEIEGLKADQSVLEEEILKQMEDVDQAKTAVGAERQTLKIEGEKLNACLQEIQEDLRRIEARIRQLQGQRGVLIPRIDPAILVQYERVLECRDGLALAPVRGNACGGCFMGLPPQLINEVQLAVRLVPCESCARILYMEPVS